MACRDIAVVGGSAGAIEALQTLVESLPEDFGGSVFVAVHYPEDSVSRLPEILGRRTPLTVAHAVDGEPIAPGRLYVAVPGRHLVIARDTVRLTHDALEHARRPAIDVMFRSAAEAYGPRVIAAVLSGALDDGTAGMRSVKQAGGLAIVQRPSEALYPSMPKSAIELNDVDYVLPVAEMGPVIAREARNEVGDVSPDAARAAQANEHFHPSTFSCPACGGVLNESEERGLIAYRCRTGHRYGTRSLDVAQTQKVEAALWEALRALEERCELGKRLADRWRRQSKHLTAERFEQRVAHDKERAALLRQTLIERQDTVLSTNADLEEAAD